MTDIKKLEDAIEWIDAAYKSGDAVETLHQMACQFYWDEVKKAAKAHLASLKQADSAALDALLRMEAKLKSGQAIWDNEYATYLVVNWETIRTALTKEDAQPEGVDRVQILQDIKDAKAMIGGFTGKNVGIIQRLIHAAQQNAAQPEGVSAENLAQYIKSAQDFADLKGTVPIHYAVALSIMNKYPNGLIIRAAQQNMGDGE